MKLLSLLVLLNFAPKASAGTGYGMAGCGVGALALGNEPGKVQILAGILNNVISPQTFAISSGTSNCTESAGRDSVASDYIDTNRDALKVDVARGSGETLAGLLSLYGCSDKGDVGVKLQDQYSKIFVESNSFATPAADINSNIKSVIRNNSLQCAVI